MAHRTILTTFFVSLLLQGSAQDLGFQLPYNPDYNVDQFIGVPDLMALLGVYGSEFESNLLVLNDDSTSAVVYLGESTFYECRYACSNLPGQWRMMTENDFASNLEEIISIADETNSHRGWLNDLNYWDNYGTQGYPNDNSIRPMIWLHNFSGNEFLGAQSHSVQNTNVPPIDASCICSIQQLRKVEYEVCTGPLSVFQNCANNLTAQGWYPQGDVNVQNLSGAYFVQSFWRWAD